MSLKPIQEEDCYRIPPNRRRSLKLLCGGGKNSKPLVPRNGELLQGRFEILYCENDKSDEIKDRIGCAAGGAGGCIYFALDRLNDEQVAVKFYSPIAENKERDEGDARYCHLDEDYLDDKKKKEFRKEAAFVRSLNGLPPNESKYFPRYIASGVYRRKRPYYVMEKLDPLSPGRPLSVWFRKFEKRSYPVTNGHMWDASDKDIEHCALEVCSGAKVLSNSLHKIALDLKPDNVMQRSSTGDVVLVDMGLMTYKEFDAVNSEIEEVVKRHSQFTCSEAGTLGFNPLTYSPHKEARMVYAIGGIIESWCGRNINPEWLEIVTQCRRIREEYTIESLDALALKIRMRKSRDKFHTILGYRRIERNAIDSVLKKPDKVVEVEKWEDVCFDASVVSASAHTIRCSLSVSGTIPTSRNRSFYELLRSMSPCEADCRRAQDSARPNIEMQPAPLTSQSPTAISTHGRLYIIDLRGLHVRVKAPVRILKGSRIQIRGPGILEVDLSAEQDVIVGIQRSSTLINTTKTFDEDFDLTQYTIGEWCYLNFKNLSEEETAKVSKRAYWMPATRAFLACGGPSCIGDIVDKSRNRIKELQDKSTGSQLVNNTLLSDGVPLNDVV